MVKKDRDALLSDFAETYHIYNVRQFPLSYIASLAASLPMSSRIKLALADMPVPYETLLMARMVDEIALFRYTFSKDAKYKRNRPKSIFNQLMTIKTKKKTDDVVVLDDPEDFWAFREKIVKGGE